jgi:hypothetical protein
MRPSGTLRGLLAIGSVLAVAACSSGSSTTVPDAALPAAAMCTSASETATGTGTVASLSENVDATCASIVGYTTWKNGATGSACTGPLDCTPVCCPCPNGTHHTLAAWCDQGQCAAPADVACMVNGTPGLAACSS